MFINILLNGKFKVIVQGQFDQIHGMNIHGFFPKKWFPIHRVWKLKTKMW
jgi:hypothetical protein